MLISLSATAIAAGVGIPIGLTVGYYRGLISSAVMRLTDIIMAFPGLLFALALIGVMGGGLRSLILAVSISFVPAYIRLVRAVVLTIRENEYIESARCVGARDTRIIWRHILPNSLNPIIVQTSLNVAAALLIASSLSFLGLGADPTLPEWGAMLNGGFEALRSAPWIATFPGLAIVFVGVAFNLLGDGLRDVFDPRLGRQ
jgi:peptide/nickel transport system permease protein